MRRYFVVAMLLLVCQHSFAQDSNDDNGLRIQAAIDACISLRDAFVANDSAAMAISADLLGGQHPAIFSNIECQDEDIHSLDGHLVFEAEFVRQFLISSSVLDSADTIYEGIKADLERGQTPDGSILTMTCVVKAGQSTKYIFTSQGHQELAVVAEAGGMITMKIRVTNRTGLDRRYDDTHNVKDGMPHRQVCFDLPNDKANMVELEVVNCGAKDCSIVIISN